MDGGQRGVAPQEAAVADDPRPPAADVPADPVAAAGAPLTVAAVAHRLGVAPATLRTWDRRYGLGPTAHAAGSHRRYGPLDVARLQTMRRLTLQGVPPSDAARLALGDTSGGTAAPTPVPDAEARQSGGGRVLAMPGADAEVRGLGRAAMSLDADAVTAAVRRAVEERGVVSAWEDVLRPVLAAVGTRWETTGQGVEVEHLLSDCTEAVLRGVAARGGSGVRAGRPALLACAPDEWHVLPLVALAAALAERGVDARPLGASLPAAALVAAVRRTGPGVLLLWAQAARTADVGVIEALPATRPATRVLVAGPGWEGRPLPDRVDRVADLKTALSAVEQAVGT